MSPNAERAWAALSRDRYDLAEQEFRGVLTENPGDAHSHSALALCLCEQERLDEAEREAVLGIGLEPGSDFAHYVHGRILLGRNRFKEARAAAEEAIRLDPEDAQNRCLLAAIHSNQQHWPESLAAADAGLAIDAEHQGCANLRVLALTHLGRKDEAAAAIRDALERSPEDSLTHANQGWALLHRNQPAPASDHFREALRIDPTNDWAREGLLTALKARNAVFRILVSYFLFMSRQRSTVRWVIVLGVFFGQGMLRTAAKQHPELAVVIYPLVAVVAVFIYSTWLANPLMNLVMRFDRYGRHALTTDQHHQANLIGGALLLAALMFGCEWMLGLLHLPSLMLVLLALPLTSIHDAAKGWPRRVSTIAASAFALIALYNSVTFHLVLPQVPDGTKEGLGAALVMVGFILLPVYFIGILLWSFIAPAWIEQARPEK